MPKCRIPRPPKDAIACWHFIYRDLKLGHRDGRKVAAGKTLALLDRRKPSLCIRGMHGSKSVADANYYHLGTILCRVLIWGSVDHGNDKICGRYRRVLWMANTEKILSNVNKKQRRSVYKHYTLRYFLERRPKVLAAMMREIWALKPRGVKKI